MASFTISDIPDEMRDALTLRASRNGTSADAEIRRILSEALLLDQGPRIGSELAAFGREFGGVDIEITRDGLRSQPVTFE